MKIIDQMKAKIREWQWKNDKKSSSFILYYFSFVFQSHISTKLLWLNQFR